MSYFEGQRAMSDGVKIFARHWTPAVQPKAKLLLLHGAVEHSGRYSHVAEKLEEAGYEVLAFDLRGYGKTEGRKGHLRHALVYQDIDELLAEELKDDTPIFMMGHSLGGQVALLYCIDRRPPLAGVVVTCPGLEIPEKDRKPAPLLKVLGLVFPTVSATLPIDDTKLISNSATLEEFRADPLVHFRGTFGMARDWYIGLDRAVGEAGQFPVPLLLVHAKADEIALCSGSEKFAAHHPGDCELKIYDSAHHDLKWEPVWETAFEDIKTWLDDHLSNTNIH
ncbi:MAG: lysophospholipase [Pseudomonadota bacterium]